jgi:hypothetical protein
MTIKVAAVANAAPKAPYCQIATDAIIALSAAPTIQMFR